MSISIHQGSILDAKVDYIVNPANSFLNHGGGLARVIDKAATAQFDPYPLERFITGPEGSPVALLSQARIEHNDRVYQWFLDHERAPLVATGRCHLTSAGALPYKGVYHAVGPIWAGGSFYETDLLEAAYEAVYEELPQGASVAFPAISAGIFGVPIAVVARSAMTAASWYEDEFETQFWLFTDEHREVFESQHGDPLFGV